MPSPGMSCDFPPPKIATKIKRVRYICSAHIIIETNVDSGNIRAKYLCFDPVWQIPFSFSFHLACCYPARFLRMLALPTVSGLCWARLVCGSCSTSLSMAWSRMMLPSSIRASWCQAANPCSHTAKPHEPHEPEARMEITETVLWQCFAPRSRFRLTIFFLKAGTAWKTRFQRNAYNL